MKMQNEKLCQQVLELLVSQNIAIESLPDQELRRLIGRIVSAMPSQEQLTLSQKADLCSQVYNKMRGLDILQEFFSRPEITEIMVNGPQDVFVEQAGLLRRVNISFHDQEDLTDFISRLFGQANTIINEQKPIAGMRLQDGSRIQAVLPPAAPYGPALSIRRFTGIKPSLENLVSAGTLPDELAETLKEAVVGRKSIFCSGGTGTGKTTFLNALSACIPKNERIITIEDSLELELQGVDNLLRLEARPPGPDGTGEVTLGDLIRSSLRLRPDRIIVGEVRGGEAFDMVQAMSTGHPGSMSTGHGNSPVEMLDRICLMILMNSALPWEAIRRLIVSAIDLIIHLVRLPNGKRIVQEVQRLKDYEDGRFILEPVYVRDVT